MNQPNRESQPAGLKVLHIASECVSYAKTGGLADVVGALPKALARKGCDVRVVLPLYARVSREGLSRLELALGVPMGPKEEWGAVHTRTDEGVQTMFLEHEHYYARPELYGPPNGEYPDNLERFVFLSRGALQLCHATGWFPDIVHAHDWHAAISCAYLNTVERGSPLGRAAGVLTIHNMDYQGNFPAEQMPLTGLGWEHFTFLEMEFHGKVSLLKAGIAHATMLTTVSPTYAWEIQNPPLGRGLEGFVSERRDRLVGILNGVDYRTWNPEIDPFLPCRLSSDVDAFKARCKEALQDEVGLPRQPHVPLLGMVTRLSYQKGIDVLIEALPRIMELEVQLVLLGVGVSDYERKLEQRSKEWPGKAAMRFEQNERLAHEIYAGSDFFLMPSRFEPGGLSQLYAMRYGSLPIVRATGGLVDTVQCYDERTGHGTGFAFNDLTPGALSDVVGWAVWAYYQRPTHIAQMRERAMAARFTWEEASDRYLSVYRRALALRRG